MAVVRLQHALVRVVGREVVDEVLCREPRERHGHEPKAREHVREDEDGDERRAARDLNKLRGVLAAPVCEGRAHAEQAQQLAEVHRAEQERRDWIGVRRLRVENRKPAAPRSTQSETGETRSTHRSSMKGFALTLEAAIQGGGGGNTEERSLELRPLNRLPSMSVRSAGTLAGATARRTCARSSRCARSRCSCAGGGPR